MKKALLALVAVASLAVLAGEAHAFGGRVVVRGGGRNAVVVNSGANVVVARGGFRPQTVIVNGGQPGFSSFNSFQSFGGCGVGSRAIIVP